MSSEIFPEKIIVPKQKSPALHLRGWEFLLVFSLITVFSIYKISQAEESFNYQEISQKLNNDAQTLSQINSILIQTEDDLASIRSQQASLQNQLEILDAMSAENESRLYEIDSLINNKRVEIQARQKQLEKLNEKIINLKNILENYVRELHYENEQSLIEILLQYETFADALKSINELEIVEVEGEKIFRQIKELYDEVAREKDQLASDAYKLEMLFTEAEKRQQEIQLTTVARQNLLEKTKNSEAQYQILLEMARERQQELSESIQYLTSRLTLDRQEIAEELRLQDEQDRLSGSTSSFAWPVSPERGITAFFNDQSYLQHFGMSHKAIDIRVAQGTPIYSPAYGYIYKTYMNGNDFAYILVAHANNTFTLYGHVSQIAVQEGDMVEKGDLLGLTGGMPGTIGAGIMTSGPHLHFETHRDGQRIDPLLVLPPVSLDFVDTINHPDSATGSDLLTN